MNGTPLSGGLNASGGGFPPIVSNANVIYVSANGNDAYAGDNINYPKATVTSALTAAGSGLNVLVKVLDGDWAEGSNVLNVPAFTTLEFANVFRGSVILRERSSFRAVTHYAETGISELVRVPSGIGANSLNTPSYRTQQTILTTFDANTDGIHGFYLEGGSRLNVSTLALHVQGGDAVVLDQNARFDGSLGAVRFADDGSTLVRTNSSGSSARVSYETIYVANLSTPPNNCRIAGFGTLAGAQCWLDIQGGEIYLEGTGHEFATWLATDQCDVFWMSTQPTNINIDYAGGDFYGLEPQQQASADTNGLVPKDTMDGLGVLTNTAPNPTFTP